MAINIKIISTDMDAAMPLPSLPTPKKLDSEKYNTDFEINGLPLLMKKGQKISGQA